MNSRRQQKAIRIGLASIILLTALSFGLYYYFEYEPSWEDIKSYIEEAPAWIFLSTLVLLPPLGIPLSVFLFAVGARFGPLWGACAACIAIALHHFIAVGLSQLFTSVNKAPSEKQSSIWGKLERKAGNNASKLLLLWGLLPGLPYVVKLYLPLTMGVSAAPYIQWNTLGHLVGAILIVGLGSALIEGLSLPVIIFIAVGIAATIGVKLFRSRLNRAAS